MRDTYMLIGHGISAHSDIFQNTPSPMPKNHTAMVPSQPSHNRTTEVTNTEDVKETKLNKVLASIPKDPFTSINLKEIAQEHGVQDAGTC